MSFSSHLVEVSMLIYVLCQSCSFPNIDKIKREKDTLILLQRLPLEGVYIGRAHTGVLKSRSSIRKVFCSMFLSLFL